MTKLSGGRSAQDVLKDLRTYRTRHPWRHRFRRWRSIATHAHEWPGARVRAVTWFVQRGRRGWADCDIWSLDHYLASWLPAAIRRLEERDHGIPWYALEAANRLQGKDPGDEDCDKGLAVAIRRATREEMARGFEAANEDPDAWTPDYERARQERVRRGLALFAMHFETLWD